MHDSLLTNVLEFGLKKVSSILKCISKTFLPSCLLQKEWNAYNKMYRMFLKLHCGCIMNVGGSEELHYLKVIDIECYYKYLLLKVLFAS